MTLPFGLDAMLLVTAVVMDTKGAGVPDAPVVLKVGTTLGWLYVAKETTDEAGRIQAHLPPDLRVREPAVRPGRGASRSV